jgi:hypothetical protein
MVRGRKMFFSFEKEEHRNQKKKKKRMTTILSFNEKVRSTNGMQHKLSIKVLLCIMLSGKK